jgi:hypothetical protein
LILANNFESKKHQQSFAVNFGIEQLGCKNSRGFRKQPIPNVSLFLGMGGAGLLTDSGYGVGAGLLTDWCINSKILDNFLFIVMNEAN